MNKQLIASMRSQMVPSEKAKAALLDAVSQPKRRSAVLRYTAAVAACAVLAVGVLSYRYMVQPLHDYIKWNTIMESFEHSALTTTTESGVDSGEGDQDMVMNTVDLVENMTGAGFTQEQIDTYLSEGWVMTWANWWKYIHTRTSEADWDTLLDVSQMPVNTGDLCASEDPSAAVAAYQNLMEYFAQEWGPVTGGYPDWYGGAYINQNASLTVLIADGPEDKDFYLQIQEWASSDDVVFDDAKFSLGALRSVQQRAADAMHELGLLIGCGVNEETNQVELDLNSITRRAQIILARLDPTGEMIQVRVAADTPVNTPIKEGKSIQPDALPGEGGTQSSDTPQSVASTPPWDGVSPKPSTNYHARPDSNYQLDPNARPVSPVDSVPEEDPASVAVSSGTTGTLLPDEDNAVAYEPIDPSTPVG